MKPSTTQPEVEGNEPRGSIRPLEGRNERMKAVEIYKNGGPEELKYEEAAKPPINPDDVLVKIYASGVNPIDYKVRKGDGRYAGSFPRIPGWDFSGVIARKPESIDHKAASGVALAGLTAWQALFRHGNLQPEQRVLIHGAAGLDQSVKATRCTREHGGYSVS